MDDLYLLISNPPHGEVDAAEAARLFGCTAAEARITINRPVAEVWLAGSADDLCGPAAALTALGARASLVPVRTLAALSKRPLLARFAFEPHGLRCEEPSGASTVVPYAGSVTAVVCRPAATERIVRLTLRQAAKAADPNKSLRQQAKARVSGIQGYADESFVDLYFTAPDGVRRFVVRPGGTSFRGLGSAMRPVVRENVNALVAALRDRFPMVHDDRRLEGASPPRTRIVGDRTLRGHLASCDASLKDIDEFDLMSRVSYLALATTHTPPS